MNDKIIEYYNSYKYKYNKYNLMKEEKSKTHFPKLSQTGTSFKNSEENPFFVPDDAEVIKILFRYLGSMILIRIKKDKRESNINRLEYGRKEESKRQDLP
mgnify:CR=1 FL=1